MHAMRRFIGLMSGTSADAIDAVLIECEGSAFKRVAARAALSYPDSLRSALLALGRSQSAVSLEALAELDSAVAEQFAAAALKLLESTGLPASAIIAVGSHGQTVFHRGGDRPATLQIGDGSRIAARCGITVVSDFRRRDIALGGQGAPLVPAFHHAVFATGDEPRAVLNLGGIANFTLLPDQDPGHVRGFDTGPAGALLDEWCQRCLGQAYDAQGAWAASGTVNLQRLKALLAEPYFAAAPPKSTGRGDFNLDWLQRLVPDFTELPAADIQATLAELTAATVAAALLEYQPQTRRLLICGGGAGNRDLLGRIRARLPDSISIESTAAFGLDPQSVEGAAFAWLAMRTLDALPGNLPSVTGAVAASPLGAIHPAG